MSHDALTLAGSLATADPWCVEHVDSIDHFLSLCARLRHRRTGAFQHRSWLRSWYACVARQPGVHPLLLAVRRESDSADAMLLPLVVRRHGKLRIAECADLGVTDCNAPVVREGLVLDRRDTAEVAQALRRALRGIDVLRLDRLAVRSSGVVNPWLRLFRALRTPLAGHRVQVDADYADWMAHLGRHARKEFERWWRAFGRFPDARFVRAADAEQGLALWRRIAALQHERHAATPGYRLAQRPYEAFYEHFLRANLDSGRCVVTALLAGDELVAGLYGVHDGRRLTVLHVAAGGERWKPCAPHRLLLERTIHAMHAQGCREFDLGAGDDEQKRIFRTTPIPLHDACVALSLRGRLYQAAWRLKHELQ